MRRFALALGLLVCVAVVGISCSTSDDAANTVRSIADDVATLAGPGRTDDGDPDPTQPPVDSDIASVMQALAGLEIAERSGDIEYARRDWRHWIDADKDCQNTRAEVLIQESAKPVSFATDERCRVTNGQWIGPWSGELFADASDVDIDHHVPLGHAHVSGGWRWDSDRKRAYANDMTNPNSLQVTDASVNRAKGKQAPDEWRPDETAGWCRYAADWISVKQQWNLTVTESEVQALTNMLDTCDDPGSMGLGDAPSE